jgi:osmotically-inducible protein OsmY
MPTRNLAKDVLDELLDDKSLDASRINVTVDGNNVELSGSVRTFHEKDDNDLASSARAGLDANGLAVRK